MSSQPWLAPDARADEPVPARPATADADELPAIEVPRPIPLRPMTAADVLDGGIAVIKAAPRTVVVVAASILVPMELLSAWVHRDTLADRGFLGALSAATSSSSSSSSSGINGATVVLFVLAGLALSIVTGAIAHLVCAWFAERAPTASEALTTSLRRTPALLFAWFAVHVIEAVAFVAGFVPIVFVAPIFMVVAPVIVVERLGPVAGVRRSWQLTRHRYGAVVVAELLVSLAAIAMTIALSSLSLAFSFLSFGWVIDVVCREISVLVTEPFLAAATTLVYLDLRIRSEGLDLELGMAEHFAGAR